ncbi:MAG: hypothetical protein IJ150_07010 [Bacteroidales bacterium]|nr:hypothetical protein [Bacteroidales bacterium]
MENQCDNLFEKFSSFVENDEDFEIGELSNFDIDKISPKIVGDIDFIYDNVLEDEKQLLQDTELRMDTNNEHDIEALIRFFEN